MQEWLKLKMIFYTDVIRKLVIIGPKLLKGF